MAVVLKLVWGTTELSFQGGASGLQLENWQPRACGLGRSQRPVTEELTLIAAGSSQDNLAATLQNLHQMQAQARAYLEDDTEATKVYFHAKLDNETGERRALVRRIEVTFSTNWFGPEAVGNLVTLALTIEREAGWEAASPSAEASGAAISALGGAFDYTSGGGADIPGDFAARIAALGLTTSSADTLDNLWLGFRSATKHGTLANFVNLWQIEAGTPGTDATETTDATASPGSGNSKSVVNFATQTGWYSRAALLLSEIIGGNYSDNYGRFVLLLRAKVDAGTTADVKLKYGYGAYINGETEPVRISATGWTLHELGALTLPFRDLRAPSWMAASYDANGEIDVWARRVSGSGSLHLDCIVAIPADEYLIRVKHAEITSSGGRAWSLSTSPLNTIGAISYNVTPTAYIRSWCEVSADGPGVPVGDGRCYIAAADVNNAHTLANTVGATATFLARWASLRGAE